MTPREKLVSLAELVGESSKDNKCQVKADIFSGGSFKLCLKDNPTRWVFQLHLAASLAGIRRSNHFIRKAVSLEENLGIESWFSVLWFFFFLVGWSFIF